MKNATITLDSLFYPELHVASNHSFDPDCELPDSCERVNAHILISEPGKFQVTVSFQKDIETDADPHDIEIFAVGLFSVSPEEGENPLDMVLWSGPNMVYGSIREMCTLLTARGPWGPYSPPAIHFEAEDIRIQGVENEKKTELHIET